MAPDTTRPSTPPAPANPLHTATARAFSSAGKTLVIVESVPGMIRAAPAPDRMRQPISAAGDVVNAETAAVTPKMMMPATRVDRRP